MTVKLPSMSIYLKYSRVEQMDHLCSQLLFPRDPTLLVIVYLSYLCYSSCFFWLPFCWHHLVPILQALLGAHFDVATIALAKHNSTRNYNDN